MNASQATLNDMAAPGWLKLLMVVAFGAIMFGVSQGVHYLSDNHSPLWLVGIIIAGLAVAGFITWMGWDGPPVEGRPDGRPLRARIAHKVVTLAMGWAGIAVAPLFAPVGKFIERREAGAAVPVAALSASTTLLFAAFLWFVAVGLPVLFFMFFVLNLLR